MGVLCWVLRHRWYTPRDTPTGALMPRMRCCSRCHHYEIDPAMLIVLADMRRLAAEASDRVKSRKQKEALQETNAKKA